MEERSTRHWMSAFLFLLICIENQLFMLFDVMLNLKPVPILGNGDITNLQFWKNQLYTKQKSSVSHEAFYRVISGKNISI